jgi:ribonucleoside-diphosphate reductase alpha chain
VSGVSFLPHSDHTYQQAPYQETTEENYLALMAQMPVGVDWSLLSKYELEDRTAGSKTLACSGSVCELVDLTDG